MDPHTRGQIIGAAKAGLSYGRIGKIFKIDRETARQTCLLDSERVQGHSKPRTGRPSKIDDRDVRTIVRYVRINPKHTYRQIKERLRVSLSTSTIKRILAPFNIRKWQARKRSELSEEIAKLRYQWVLTRKDWTTEEWAVIIFSDESSVERGQGGQREWVWRTAEQKWSPQFVQTYKKGHDISIMVWGAIWIGGRSDLVIMTRDDDAARNGYTTNSYLEVLNDALSRCWQPGMKFMQDNAPINTAKKISK